MPPRLSPIAGSMKFSTHISPLRKWIKRSLPYFKSQTTRAIGFQVLRFKCTEIGCLLYASGMRFTNLKTRPVLHFYPLTTMMGMLKRLALKFSGQYMSPVSLVFHTIFTWDWSQKCYLNQNTCSIHIFKKGFVQFCCHDI